MAAYQHFQDVKKAEPLPETDKMGLCLNCSYWDVEGQTSLEQKQHLARCVYPSLQPFALVVSGTSACNKWKERENVDAEAKAYSKQGE